MRLESGQVSLMTIDLVRVFKQHLWMLSQQSGTDPKPIMEKSPVAVPAGLVQPVASS